MSKKFPKLLKRFDIVRVGEITIDLYSKPKKSKTKGKMTLIGKNHFTNESVVLDVDAHELLDVVSDTR